MCRASSGCKDRNMALRESRAHGGNYRFLSIRCDCNCDHFHRLPLSVGTFNGSGGLWLLASNRIRERIYPLKAFVTLHRDCSSQSLWLTGPHTSLAGSWPPPLSFLSLMP